MKGSDYLMKCMGILLAMLILSAPKDFAVRAQPVPLDGSSIPKFVDPLPQFANPNLRVDATIRGTRLTVSMKPNIQPVLSTGTQVAGGTVDPADVTGKIGWTKVWAYEINNNRGKGGPANNGIYGPLWPAFSIEAKQGVPINVRYRNLLNGQTYADVGLKVDQTLHWANPFGYGMMDEKRMDPYEGPVPAVVHLHGGEVPSSSDGGPDQWFLPEGVPAPPGGSRTGSSYNPNDYCYPNDQEAATLFFHDHTLGATRLNLYAGLAGFYLLRDNNDDGCMKKNCLPAGKYEIELGLQDRMFDNTGQLLFPSDVPPNPLIHPFWVPEFFGDAMCVNGKTWPYLNVEARRYRFRIVNGSNARFYKLYLTNAQGVNVNSAIWQIGSDGGLLDAPVNVKSLPEGMLLLGTGERADIIIDFAAAPGATLTLRNTARAPYPDGDLPDPETVGQVMQFRVGPALAKGADDTFDPAKDKNLRKDKIVRLTDPAKGQLDKQVNPIGYRQLTLNEIEGDGGPLEPLVNNSKWMGTMSPNSVIMDQDTRKLVSYSEMPQVGSTEVWEIVNLTMDAHPIHLHLVQFQLLNRQKFDMDNYMMAYDMAFPGTNGQKFPAGDPMGMVYPAGMFIPAFGPPMPYNTVIQRPGGIRVIGGNPDVTPYLTPGTLRVPNANETGWKDTYLMYPGEVTRVVVRWTPQSTKVQKSDGGKNYYSFDPTAGPGYVWHCHIVDHEDNEMMRPQVVRWKPPTAFVGRLAKEGASEMAETATLANENLPTTYALSQNYPNPFNPSTEIRFALPEDTHVTLTVYNNIGQEVATLIDQDAPAGYHSVKFDAKHLASGVYFYRLSAGSYVSTQKMVLMK